MSLRTITYTSAARRLYTQDMLVGLLRRARIANAAHGITGMLLYKDGCFLQAIEGPATAVEQLYRNIRANPAHHLVITMIDDSIDRRAFADWCMGFKDVSAGQPQEPGFTDFLNMWPGAVTTTRRTPPEELLVWFRDTQR